MTHGVYEEGEIVVLPERGDEYDYVTVTILGRSTTGYVVQEMGEDTTFELHHSRFIPKEDWEEQAQMDYYNRGRTL